MARHIAIIFTHDQHDSYEDWSKVIDSITNWTEVSEAQYKVLTGDVPWEIRRKIGTREFKVIERPTDEPRFVTETVEQILAAYKKIEDEVAARKAAEQKKAEEKRIRKLASKTEREREALKKLIEQNPDLVKEIVAAK